MILLLMINIILSMILCMFINYHIYCGFPAAQIRFLAVPDLYALSGAPRPTDTRCATPSAAFSSICCVPPLPRDRPITPIKGRCGYSLTVVHFRKLRNSVKIGSHRNGYPVI